MHATRSWYAALLFALVAAPATALAGDGGTSASGLLSRLGEYTLVGGGITDFAEDDARDRFDVGASWDVRLGIGSRFYVGGELAYVGSARGADGAGPDLRSHGAEAVLRLQYPYASGKWLVEPFAFGGVGWSRTSLEDAPPGLADDDDVGTVPFGGGVTLGYGRFLFDARFTYRAAFDEDLALAVGDAPADLAHWGVTAAVGYEF
jgi:hypothetical protein